MPSLFDIILKAFMKRHSLSFLGEMKAIEKQEIFLNEKLKRVSKTNIGKEIGITPKTPIHELPLTGYGLYKPYFEHPQEGDFLYPLDDYVKNYTSGTMGKPKTYLLPKSGILDNVKKTGSAIMLLSTHDGEKITYEVGDVFYRNIPGGSYISAFLTETSETRRSRFRKQVPENDDLSFQEKVDYFVEHYRDIDVAYMTVTTLLEEIYPRIGEPFYLKGFLTQDRSARILKEEIKKVTGNYPKMIFGSTETMLATLPSIEFPGAFFFDWRVIYPEFLHEKDAISPDFKRVDTPSETVPPNEVKVGEKYQLIATPFKTDMTRYVMPDILECVEKSDDILNVELPVFNYFTRADKLLVLHNFTRIVEEELIQVLKNAGIPFVDFTARRELEGPREYMAMYIELSAPLTEEEVSNRLNRELLEFDKDWRDLTNFMKYKPLKVTLLPKGSFKRYLQRKKGLPKIERVEMRCELFKDLILDLP